MDKPDSTQAKRTFYGVQWLRGLATTMVVVFHVSSNLAGKPVGVSDHSFGSLTVLRWGNAGVDLFFLISGFVIVWTTQHHWSRRGAWFRFLAKRVSRIFPLYWILTTAKIALVLAIPFAFRGTHLRPWNTLASYLLIPSRDAEGRINPVITAGWTLCFEMAFYYVCVACLALRRPPIVLATPLFVVLGLLGLWANDQWGPIASLINPLLLEFVAGMWIAELARRGMVRASLAVIAALLVLGVGLWCASDLLPSQTEFACRALVWGGPAAIILYAVIALEARFAFGAYRLPMLIGDASYSIYLTHVLVLPPLAAQLRHRSLAPWSQWACCWVLAALGILSGVVAWRLIERMVIRTAFSYARPMREVWASRRKAA